MNVEIGYRPSQSLASVRLNPGEAVMAESGAMVGMSTNVQMQTSSGGMMGGLKRLFGGESFFRNTFTATGGPGEVLFATPLCGDMIVLPMTPQGYIVQSSSFVASSPEVQVNTKWGGARTFFGGEGLFTLQVTTQTPNNMLIVGAFGGIQEIQCDGRMIIDTGHLVAWDASLTFKVTKSGSGWIQSFLSGEGLVCDFEGQGRIWIQTRNPAEYGTTIGRLLPPRQQ